IVRVDRRGQIRGRTQVVCSEKNGFWVQVAIQQNRTTEARTNVPRVCSFLIEDTGGFLNLTILWVDLYLGVDLGGNGSEDSGKIFGQRVENRNDRKARPHRCAYSPGT